MTNNSNSTYGVIHEDGDLGLGFSPLKDEEKEKVEKKNPKKEK